MNKLRKQRLTLNLLRLNDIALETASGLQLDKLHEIRLDLIKDLRSTLN